MTMTMIKMLALIRKLFFASLRTRVRKKNYDLYCSYLSSEVMVKSVRGVRGHFVTLVEISMHLMECNPEHISLFVM